jgi:hypothetical protein
MSKKKLEDFMKDAEKVEQTSRTISISEIDEDRLKQNDKETNTSKKEIPKINIQIKKQKEQPDKLKEQILECKVKKKETLSLKLKEQEHLKELGSKVRKKEIHPN